MDFFEYASIVSMFVNDKKWIAYSVGVLCFAVVFIFQAVALYVISGREGYKNRWMSFVPFFNTYYLGVCGQRNRAFRSVDTKKLALAAAILEAVLFICYLVYNVAIDALTDAGCYISIEEDMLWGTVNYQKLVSELVPQNLKWAEWCDAYLYDYILWWINLVYIFLDVLVLSAFFQTYASKRYFVFTVTSVFFPIRGILFYTVRNNKGQSYREYLYREQERRYRMYRQYNQGNPYNNPYNNSYNQNHNNNPYGNNPYNQNSYGSQGTSAPDDPFGGLGGKENNDPFNDYKN